MKTTNVTLEHPHSKISLWDRASSVITHTIFTLVLEFLYFSCALFFLSLFCVSDGLGE